VKGLAQKGWWVVLTLVVVFGLSRLRIDVDVLNLLPPNQPGVEGLKLHQEHFSNARELIITLRGSDAGQVETVAAEVGRRLGEQTNLVAEANWQPPWMEQPALAAEIAAYLWFNSAPGVFGSLTNRLSASALQGILTEARESLATSLSPLEIARRAVDPYDLLNVPAITNLSGFSLEQGQGMFASADGGFRLIFVRARGELNGYQACASWLKSVQDLVTQVQAQLPGGTGIKARYTGRPAFVAEIAGSMQKDLSASVLGTAVIIALLFWLTHRRWRPMLWLLALLMLILVATIGLGSLLLGPIHVISLGFAAVLLGLAVDYAVVHYQEALSHPGLSVPEIRRAIAPSILWAALTTIAAFLVLNFSGLPGLAQLGSLVGIGVALAAVVMVAAFLPPLFPERRQAPAHASRPAWWQYFLPPAPLDSQVITEMPVLPRTTTAVTVLVLAAIAVALLWRFPGLDRSGAALKFQQTDAETALEEITTSVGIPRDPLWVVTSGPTATAVRARLDRAETLLREAAQQQQIDGYLLPGMLWPQVEWQQQNQATARQIAARAPDLRAAALAAGFTTNALFLTEELMATWKWLGESTAPCWPTNRMSQWLLDRFVAKGTNQWYALGLVYPRTNAPVTPALLALSGKFQREGVSLSGWPLLGAATLESAKHRWALVLLPMVLLVLLSLTLAFRRPVEVLLSLATLLLSGLCLLAVMGLAGWTWNLLNLMAVPLILGTGVDYGIFIQLGLRRQGGDVALVRRSIGRALLLCGGTAITGFGALAWSGNVGMASLGRVCAVGIALNMLIAIFLLPHWWNWATSNPRKNRSGDVIASGDHGQLPAPQGRASALYGARLWRLGILLTRACPERWLKAAASFLVSLYGRVNRARREVVVNNLLPAVGGNRAEAEVLTRRLFAQFGIKLVELWKFENGIRPTTHLEREEISTEILAARDRGQGILLVTPHLGNWEVGAAILREHGMRLLVVTQEEPGAGFTKMRSDSRSQWDIETLVVGSDAFAFVELIRRLQEGAVAALLIDRPHAASAVNVELFGRPFEASIAPAELARASGCAVFGVVVAQTPNGHAVTTLPEFTYDRRALGIREERRAFTQRIIRAFEPKIRDHLDQWYNFVPVWPRANTAETRREFKK